MENSPSNIPPQMKGQHSDNCYQVETESNEAARHLFYMSAQRLLDVNNWGEIAKGSPASFQLTDSDGNEVQGKARKGLFFQIDLPAPGNDAGEGSDYVVIESIEDNLADNEAQENYISMRVRPAPRPGSTAEEAAHFFTTAATSNFIVHRKANVVSACVMGRNEEPNNEETSMVDKIRNTLVATAAILGLADMQWKALVKGIVGDTIDKGKD